ncbi:MAG: hypothetical protein Q7S83_02500 [bacterium]|nr:hypothetical protein [bacterium]
MEHEPKISLAEAFLLVAYIGLTDIIGIILVFFALDDFFILDILTFPVTQIYFRIKGVSKAGYDIAMNMAELIPYVGALPLRTIGVLMVISADRNPSGATAQITNVASKINIRNPKGSLSGAAVAGKSTSTIPMAQFPKGQTGIPMAEVRPGAEEAVPMARFPKDSKDVPMASDPNAAR